VDYCYKVGTAGYKIIYRPESVAIHYESQSAPQRFTYEDANFAKLVSKWSGKIPLAIRLLAEGKRDVLRPFKRYSSLLREQTYQFHCSITNSLAPVKIPLLRVAWREP